MLEGAAPSPSAKTYAGWGAKILGGVAVLAAVALALWHVFQFLRDGIWPNYPSARMLADLGIPSPGISWLALQHAIDWVLSWSAAGVLTCFGLILAFIGGFLTDSYDTRMEAAAAARAEFRSATDVERATGWARAEQDRERGRTEEEAAESAAALPEPSFGRSLVSNLLGVGCVVFVIAGGAGLFIGWDYFDSTHYDRVSAQVHSVQTSCLLEWEPPRDPAWWESSTARRSGEMPCAEAMPQVRGMNPRLIEFKTVTYSYRSPVDGRTYPGSLHRESAYFPPDVHAGGEMIAYSLKVEPSRSRGMYLWPVD